MEKGEGSVFFGPCCCINAFSIRVEGAKTSCKQLSHKCALKKKRSKSYPLPHSQTLLLSFQFMEASGLSDPFRRLYETHSSRSEPPSRPSSVRSRSFVRHLLAIKEQHESEKLFLLPPQSWARVQRGERNRWGIYSV